MKNFLYLCSRKGFMKELPTYTPDFGSYTRMKEAGTDGFPYERLPNRPASRTTRERLLSYLHGRPWADNKQLSYVLHISMSTVRYHLRKLQKDGIIVRHYGMGDRGNCWEIIKE